MKPTSKYQEYVVRLIRDCEIAEWALGGVKRSYDQPQYMEQFIDTAIRKLQDAKRDLQYFKNVEPPKPPTLPGQL